MNIEEKTEKKRTNCFNDTEFIIIWSHLIRCIEVTKKNHHSDRKFQGTLIYQW